VKPLDRRPGYEGHVLLLYHEDSYRRTGVTAWLRRGLELGDKILYIEPPDELPARSLSGLLEDQPEAGEAVERGQIEVIAADRTAYDPGWQASVVKDALLQGYPAVRWSADATTAWSVMPRARHAEVELATDRLCQAHPVSVLCQYPVRESMEVLGPVSTVHGSGLRERLFQAAPRDGGLAVSGEVDASNHDILRALLQAATAATDHDSFVVDLSGLDFLDIRGARALMAGTAAHRRHGGQVRLRAPQPVVDRLVRLLAFDRSRGVLMEGGW
jgi:anti-anti-sigma factor